MSYIHFTLNERKCLEKLLSEGLSMRKIALALGRSPSTISREIARNKAKYKPHKKPSNDYWYNYWRAQNLYIIRRRQQSHRRLKADSDEWNFIVEALNRFWTPEEICGRWSLLYPYRKSFSVSTIYRYIKRKEFPNITPKTHLRRRGKKYISKSANFNSIQPDRLIHEWEEVTKLRERIGDWEGDTVLGGVGKGALVSLVDRKSRFLCAKIIKDKTAKTTRSAVVSLLKEKVVHSITFDNGSEFAEFREIEKKLNTMVYFAEPHKPWQRGTNENTNGILRYFFPKGYNFLELNEKTLELVVLSINMRPRKCLGWKSAFEVFYGVALA